LPVCVYCADDHRSDDCASARDRSVARCIVCLETHRKGTSK
jgi:hypothetical protein